MEDGNLAKSGANVVRNEPLTRHHDVSRFRCGVDSLDVFIARHALTAPQQGLSQTWVTVNANKEVLAFHTLALSSFTRAETTDRVSKGMPNDAIPCVLLARMAVDQRVQGEGLGGLVLEAAMRKAVALGRGPVMADESPGLPLRALVVQAIDDKAAGFYRHFGYEPSPTDTMHLFLLLKDIEKSILAIQNSRDRA